MKTRIIEYYLYNKPNNIDDEVQMEFLLGNNYFYIFIFTCITFLTYSGFKNSQKMIIIYILIYGSCSLKLISVRETILFLVAITFLFLEALISDEKKLRLINKFHYKVLDYLFISIFQYNILYIVFAIVLTSSKIEVVTNTFNIPLYLIQWLSIIVFIFGIFQVSRENFKMKEITELIKVFENPTLNMTPFDKINEDIFAILVEMEDKTFFERENSYNFLSWEFVSYKLRKFREIKSFREKYKSTKWYMEKSIHIRGYSTLEMQLIRRIGLEYGYYRVVTRKIYELIYTYILFSSLKKFYYDNNYANKEIFKKYLLYKYITNVDTKIIKKYYPKISEYIGNNEEEWSKEKAFLAFVGLPQGDITKEIIFKKYSRIIEKYKLDEKVIKQLIKGV